jgi:lysophospholipase L1-like esterase
MSFYADTRTHSALRLQHLIQESLTSPKMRIAILGLVLVVSLGMSACESLGSGGNDDSSPTTPTGPPAAGATVNYSVVGASDAIGYGSSKPCVLYDDCDGNGYVWVAARTLRTQGFTVNVQQLGIPGAVISRTFQDLAAQYGRSDVLANLIQQVAPFVNRSATLVTVFTGANDINVMTTALGKGAGGTDPTAFIDQTVAAFTSDYATLIGGIRARATAARLIVFNVPNLAAMPYLSTASLAQKQAAQRAAVRITTTVINPTPGTTVIDLMCDSRLYQPSVVSADGFHPNDAGYALIGAEIVKALTSSSYPAPKSSCSQMFAY